MDPKVDNPEEAAAQAMLARLSAHMHSGGTLGQWVGLEPADAEAAYALGGFFYEREEYDTALRVYLLLLMADPYDRRFMIAAGMSKQMLKLYDDALGYYAQALAFDFDDPLPSLHMAECLVQKGQPADALTLLNVCLSRARNPEHQELREQAKQLHALIEAARPKEAQA